MARLVLSQVVVSYPGNPPVEALRGVSATFDQGDFVAIEGTSGGGKSTLMNVLGLLHSPTGGCYRVDDVDVSTLTSKEQARLRSNTFAFVFQSFHLLDRRPVLDSVELGMLYQGLHPDVRRQRAVAALEKVGLAAERDRLAATLSGGQRQRVAIARALAMGARVLLADEPTGNLDSASGDSVMQALQRVNAQGVTVIIVTHDRDVAAQATRRLLIRDGVQVAAEGEAAEPAAVPVRAEAISGSILRLPDLLRDAVASLRSRGARTWGLAIAVAVAVGLAVTTLGLSSSAAAQVSSTFDAHENNFVTAEIMGRNPEGVSRTGWREFSAAERRDTVLRLAGVEGAVVIEALGTMSLATAPWRESGQAESVRIGSGLSTAEPVIEWSRGNADDDESSLDSGHVLVGVHVAENLELGPLDGDPVILVEGIPYVVAGIVHDGGRLPGLTGSIVMGPADLVDQYVSTTTILAHTSTGASQQVASQIALAVEPTEPEAVSVVAPIDPDSLRDDIESDLRTALLALTVAAVIAAVVSLTNSMTAAVQERRSEFGLRRAVGAGSRHIFALVVLEAGLVALVGAVMGLLAGIYGVLGVTIARHWAPVLDLRMVPLSVLGGMAVGLLGALWQREKPSASSRIKPCANEFR